MDRTMVRRAALKIWKGKRFPLYAGLQVVDIEPYKLGTALGYVRDGGAEGVAIFSFKGGDRLKPGPFGVR